MDCQEIKNETEALAPLTSVNYSANYMVKQTMVKQTMILNTIGTQSN